MSANDLLSELGRQGIRLEADGGRLWCYPPEALTPDLLARLKAHKAELLAILSTNQQAEAAKHGDQPQADQAGQADSPSDTGHQTTAPTSRPSPPGDPATDDQAGHREAARRCLAQRLEALQLAGVQQLGRARQAAEAGVPAVPADVATETADSPAATTPDAPADPSEADQAEAPAATQADGQASGQTDAQAASGGDLDLQRLWLAAMAELAGELPQDVLRGCLTAVVRYGGPGNPLCQPGTRQAKCRCGSTAWKDVVLTHSPHNGRSVRRDCARCGRALGLLRWYGGPGDLADDLPGHGELSARS
jgi:hypothetical protein